MKHNWYPAIAVFHCILTVGCSAIPEGMNAEHFHGHPCKTRTQNESEARDEVFVGGLVRSPQAIQIPSEGLSLRQAVQMAGTVETLGPRFATSPTVQERNSQERIQMDLDFRDLKERLNAYAESEDRTVQQYRGQLLQRIDTPSSGGPITLEELKELTEFLRPVDTEPVQQFVQELNAFISSQLNRNGSRRAVRPPSDRSDAAANTQLALVALDRTVGNTETTFYFSLSDICSEIVGDIPVWPKDILRVGYASQTPFGNPNQYTRTKARLIGVGGRSSLEPGRIQSVSTNLGLNGKIPASAIAMQITRLKKSGRGSDVLVLSLPQAQSESSAALNLDGRDVMRIARPLQLPVIQAGIVQAIVDTRTRETLQRLPDRKERLVQRAEEENVLNRTVWRIQEFGAAVSDHFSTLGF